MMQPAPLVIRRDDLRAPAVVELLQLHLRSMTLHSPPESIHAFGVARLRQPDVTFWTAWQGTALRGCGALKALDATHGELKSMRTVESHLRTGVGSALLRHLIDEARRRGYARLSLETGSAAAFVPARSMYANYGFVECGPFADYREDPYSVFMTRTV